MNDITSINLSALENRFIHSHDSLDSYWTSKSLSALTPDHQQSWTMGIRNSWDIPQMVSNYLLASLTQYYTDLLTTKVGVWDKYLLDKPFLFIEKNSQGEISTIHLTPEVSFKVHNRLKSHVSNIMDKENIWQDLIKWFWNQSTAWTLEKISKEYSLESQYRMSDKEWAYIYSKSLCFSESSYFRFMFDRYAQHLSELLLNSLVVNHKTLYSLEEFLSLRECSSSTIGTLLSPQTLSQSSNYLTSFSMAHFQQLRKVLAARDFVVGEKSAFPQASLNTPSGSVNGTALLKCSLLDRDVNHAYAQEMNDETVDVLDAICYLWLKKAETDTSLIHVCADDILRLRGLQEQKNGQGQRGGYKQEWRERIAKHIYILHNTWIKTTHRGPSLVQPERVPLHREVESHRAIIVSDFTSPEDEKIKYNWLLRPGDSFASYKNGSWRQTALISEKILHFDPYRQAYEKRAARTFPGSGAIVKGTPFIFSLSA